jgi:hypothetical protein
MYLPGERMEEGNPMLPDDAASIAVCKLGVMGVAYLIGEVRPQWRESIWTALGVVGYGAAAWNIGMMIEHDVTPWRE